MSTVCKSDLALLSLNEASKFMIIYDFNSLLGESIHLLHHSITSCIATLQWYPYRSSPFWVERMRAAMVNKRHQPTGSSGNVTMTTKAAITCDDVEERSQKWWWQWQGRSRGECEGKSDSGWRLRQLVELMRGGDGDDINEEGRVFLLALSYFVRQS